MAAAVTACSCARPAQRVEAKAGRLDRLAESVPRDRYADDVARFLAGMPARPGSRLADLQEEDAWKKHQREMDAAWSRLDAKLLTEIRDFQKQELSQPAVVNSPAFYPFSGPDSLMVTTFFPHNRVYVLAGLEPPGSLPSPRQIERKRLGEYLAKVRTTVGSELGRSFFITRQMDRQFRGQVTDGLFLPIVQLLVRTHHMVLGYRYIRLDETGHIVERPAEFHAPGITNKGVEIDFQADDDASVHKLVYFSVNLSDKTLQENKPFLAFVGGLKGATTFLKATSYMIHKPEFSIIRAQVLAQSGSVLQDDSGIPYRFFNAPDWRVQLYGSYERPYGSFRWLQQKDLRAAYETTGPKALGFRIGYGYGKVPSNLLFAVRN